MPAEEVHHVVAVVEITAVVVIGVVCFSDQLITTVITTTIQTILLARFAARLDIPPFAVGIVWTTTIKMIPHLQPWRPPLHTILILTSTMIPTPWIISQVIMIGLLSMDAIMAVNKCKSAMEQVCRFYILVNLQLILLLVYLNYVIFYMCLPLLKIFCLFINYPTIMMYFLNFIRGIFHKGSHDEEKSSGRAMCGQPIPSQAV
jgi:hypothetical protein